MGKWGRVTLCVTALLFVVFLGAGGLKAIQLSTEIGNRVSIPIFLSHSSQEVVAELQSIQGVERVIEHDQGEIKALYKELVGLEWEESMPEVLEVFVQPAQAQKVYNHLARHPEVLFAAFDGETMDVFARWGALLRYGGIALLGSAGVFGIVIWRWTRPMGALASCLLCLILWGGVLNPTIVHAGYVTDLRQEVMELQKSVDKFEGALDSLQKNTVKLEEQIAADQNKLEKHRVQIGSLQQETEELEQERKRMAVTVANLQAQRDDLTAVSSERQTRLEKVMQADLRQTMAPKGNRTLDWAVVRFALMREVEASKEVQSERNTIVRELKARQGQQTALDNRYDNVVHELANYHDEAASLENALTEHEDKLGQNRRKQEELIRNISSYDERLQKQERVLGQSLVGSAFPVSRDEFLGWPLPVSGTLTSDYGLRIHPIFGDERVHTGVDLACETGTPVLAAADGVVTYSGELGGYGLAVVVDHYQGMSTLYGHASELKGQVGQRVEKGDVIALVGSTGLSTGPHLHFEVREENAHVDPWVWLQ